MLPNVFKKLCWKSLLFLSPSLYEGTKDWYERTKATWRFGNTFPDYFNNTKTIFIHIPKAAGTSVAMALYGRQTLHEKWQYWHELNPRKFREYFKFSVIRNPITRFTSAFYYLKSGGMNALDKEFGETVLKDYADPNELAKSLVELGVQKQILNWQHFEPQSNFVCDELGRSKMNLLIRMENIEAGFEAVVRRLNCKANKLPHLNKSRNVREIHLDKEALDVLDCLYRKDYILWEKEAS